MAKHPNRFLRKVVELIGQGTGFPAFHNDDQGIMMVLAHLDLLYADIRHLDRGRHEEWTGLDNELILANIRAVSARPGRPELIVRMPVVQSVNDDAANLHSLARQSLPGAAARRPGLVPQDAEELPQEGRHPGGAAPAGFLRHLQGHAGLGNGPQGLADHRGGVGPRRRRARGPAEEVLVAFPPEEMLQVQVGQGGDVPGLRPGPEDPAGGGHVVAAGLVAVGDEVPGNAEAVGEGQEGGQPRLGEGHAVDPPPAGS